MDLKLKLTTDEIIEKFLPNLPPETGVAIEIEDAGAERTLPRVATDGEKSEERTKMKNELSAFDTKNIVIISIYDGGYGGFSVMVDDVISCPHDIDCEEKNIADVLYGIYREFGSDDCVEEFKKMFPDKLVIVCDNECINVL